MPWIERRGVLSVQSVDVILQLAHQGNGEYLMLYTHSSVLDWDTGNNNSYV